MMPRIRALRSKPLLAGIATSLCCAFLLFHFSEPVLERPRELFFDALTQAFPGPETDRVVVVDIDRKALQWLAGEEWTRSQSAALISAIATARPAAVAIDLVFSNDCDLREPTNRTLAEAIGQAPAILGFLIGEQTGATPGPAPELAVQRPIAIPPLWFIDGVDPSCPIFQERAAAAAASFLIGDEDAIVRRAQPFAIYGNAVYPALGLEAARRAAGAGASVIGGTPPWIRQDERLLWPDDDGNLRFVAAGPERIVGRTISAADVMSGTAAPERIRGKVVLVGSSLPALGGLRASASLPLEPSVQIHADVANTVLTGFIPHRNSTQIPWEAGYAFLAGVGAAALVTRLRPTYAATSGLVAIVSTIAGAAFVYRQTGLLIDAPAIVMALATVLLVTGVLQFAQVRRAEQTARARFGQYLPPSVVSRYIDNPGLERVAAEERQVTALFTDIEDFSALSGRIGPQRLVPLLDVYFREVNALVASHGGMVNKVVGDAVHALFNAPEDLDRHVDRAIDCAREIHALTEEMRGRADFAAEGFGRTRIGIETGLVILGEVGTGGTLDYTAHGMAMNIAARLQEANKVFGTAICIGPAAAGETTRRLRSLGVHEIRGVGPLALFTIADDG